MSPRPPTSRCKGSALVAILWIIAILSLTIFSATQFLFVSVESESNASALFRAEALADRGIAIASHPLIEKGDRLLHQSISETESFSTRISTEGGRLNLNTLLENAERDRIVLEELFFQWGMRSDEASSLVDHLVDWVDPDGEPTGEGAERSDYLSRERSNHPFNRPFEDLDEALLVKDFEKLVALKPDWADSFTLLSSGPLDLNEAPPELIAAACQCAFESARLFVVTRNGRDEIPGNEDDYPLTAIEDALALLGIAGADLESILPRLSIFDPVTRLVSVGRYGSVSVERTVVINASGNNGGILRWNTRRIQ